MSVFLQVADQLIRETKRPMRPAEIVDLAIQRRLLPDTFSGKTPQQTMKSKLSVHVRRKGESSTFVRTESGRFTLRELVLPSEVYLAKPQEKPNPREQVLTFPASRLRKRDRFQGIRERPEKLLARILTKGDTVHIDRLIAEKTDEYKQVLTYIMVTQRGRVLAYKRGNFNRVADFLRGSHCIGFGGHVAKPDADLFGIEDMGLRQGAIRELQEELHLPHADIKRLSAGEGLELVGMLNDDSSDVGQRHFAFLFCYEVSDDASWSKPERGEKSITQLRWLSPNSGLVNVSEFEYWSQLCLRHFFPKIAHAVPHFRLIRRRPLRPPHLLCVLGEVGSGKSAATRMLKESYGYHEINSGRVVAKILGIPPVPKTDRIVFQAKAWEFISKKGSPRILAGAIWEEVQGCGFDQVLVDGVRQRATLEALRKISKNRNLGVLYVHTPPDLAYKFYMLRESKGISIFEFLEIRRAAVERDVPGMITFADAVLYNWMGQAEYRKAIEELMALIKERGNDERRVR